VGRLPFSAPKESKKSRNINNSTDKLLRDRIILNDKKQNWYNGKFHRDINIKMYALDADFYKSMHDLEHHYTTMKKLTLTKVIDYK